MSNTVTFLAADSLNMTLYHKKGQLWGLERKTFQFGPWNLDMHVRVYTDIYDQDQSEIGLWVHLTSRLWMYLAITRKRTLLLVFDAKEVGITDKGYEKMGRKSLEDTMRNVLGSKIREVFEYTENKKIWFAVFNFKKMLGI